MILRTLLFFFIPIYTILSFSVKAQLNNEWKLTRNQDNIKIYVRKHQETALKEVFGIMTVKGSLSSVVSTIKDSQNHHKWLYANKISKILKKNSDFDWILYTESEAPWPVSNRDLISHAKMSQDQQSCTVKIESESIPDYIPSKKNLVRIEKMHSIWNLTPLKNGYVEIKFEIIVDLGGNIPRWMVNLAVDKGPYYTLLNIAAVLKEEKYQSSRLSYIKERCP